jgi:hypothetical protein
MAGNLSKGRKLCIKALADQDRGFWNRLVNCSSEKLLIVLKDASCFRTEGVNKLNHCR